MGRAALLSWLVTEVSVVGAAASDSEASRSVVYDGTNYTELTDHTGQPGFVPDVGSIATVSSFGEDDLGNLYVVDLGGGEVFLIPEPGAVSMQLAGAGLIAALARRRTMRAATRPAA